MSPEPTSSQRDALALIAGIERASRRSRPFFLFGLLAVILGFVSVSVYLYQDREEERAQKAVLEKQVAELTRTLNAARALGPQLDDSPAARERLRILLGQAIGTAQALPADVAQAETQAPATAAPRPEKAPRQRPDNAAVPNATETTPPPRQAAVAATRLVIYVSDQEQEPQAAQLMMVVTLDGSRVPYTINRARTAGDNTLRCFTPSDCRRAGDLLRQMNGRLRSPVLTAWYQENRRNARPGTYELWLAPGPLPFRGLGE